MAITDWNQVNAPSSQGAQTDVVDTGTYSWQLNGSSSAYPEIVLEQTSTDSPAEGQVSGRVYIGSGCRFSVLVRFQDHSNHYRVRYNRSVVELVHVISGGGSVVDDTGASVTESTWTDFEVIFWEDNGTFNTRLLQNGSQLGRDLSDSNNYFSSGGGMGFRAVGSNAYLDENEVFY